MTREIAFEGMTIEKVRALFEAKIASNEAERMKERKLNAPDPVNKRGLAITVFAFLDAEANAYLAAGGTPRYSISEKQLWLLDWYDTACPTAELRALINEAENGSPVIYDWRNLQVLMTELVEDNKIAKEMDIKEVSLDAVPAHIRARIENMKK